MVGVYLYDLKFFLLISFSLLINSIGQFHPFNLRVVHLSVILNHVTAVAYDQ